MKGIFYLLIFSSLMILSCNEDEGSFAPAIEVRDSLPILKSRGVSTLISDSGIIRYKIIAEEWYIYDRRNPSFWAFEKGLFIEKFDDKFHVEAYVNADTAYYYDKQELWELRGRVQVKNLKGETFKTSLLYWDQRKHELYSDRYMEIKGETQELSGYNFRSDEQMTNYSIHSSKGAFPLGEEEHETPTPDASMMSEYNDSTEVSDSIVNNRQPSRKLLRNNQSNDVAKSAPNKPRRFAEL